MDSFARALVAAHSILEQSAYRQMRRDRYASFDSGEGADFESGKLSFTDLVTIATQNGEPEMQSESKSCMRI